MDRKAIRYGLQHLYRLLLKQNKFKADALSNIGAFLHFKEENAMVKTKFKKAVSLVLAAVMSLTAFMGSGATTAFAAVGEKADVYLVD